MASLNGMFFSANPAHALPVIAVAGLAAAFEFHGLRLTAGTGSDQKLAFQSRQAVPCRRPPPRRTSEGGDTVLVTAAPRAPCRLEVVSTPVVLRADSAGTVEGIGTAVAKGSDGRFYTSWNERITVWNPDGRVSRTFGTRGVGPGEFAVGAKSIYVDRENRLFVRDNNDRWTVISPTGQALATWSATGMGFAVGMSALLDDGMFLTAQPAMQTPGFYFNVYDFSLTSSADSRSVLGARAVIRSFGALPTGAHSGSRSGRERVIAYSGGSTFWAGPPRDGTRGYEIEQWTTDGRKLRTLRRRVAWFPQSGAAPSTGRASRERPRPGVSILHADNAGLLYVTIGTISPRWRADGDVTEFLEMYVEVIDPLAGVVLASIGPMPYAQAVAMLPAGYFAGTRHGFRLAETPEGYPVRQIVELRLVEQ